MIKLSIMADLHLRATEPYDGKNSSRLDEKLGALGAMVNNAITDNHEMIILAGDTFDSQDPPEWLRAKFIDALDPCFCQDLRVYILVGNHETNGQKTAFDSLVSLQNALHGSRDWPLRIITEPTIVKYDKVIFNLVPYCKPEAAIEAVTSCPDVDNKSKILVGHFDVDGAQASGGNSFKIPTILRRHHFDGYVMSFLGHIHQRQVHLTADRLGFWTYVGSPVYQDFGERDDTSPKGYYEVTVDDDGDVEYTDIPIVSTEFTQVEATEETLSSIKENGTTSPVQELRRALKGKICKVVFIGTEDFLKSSLVQKYRLRFRKLEQDGYAVKVICDTRCTDRQIINQEESAPEAEGLDVSMEFLCKERDAEAFLAEGRTYLEAAHNAVAKS